MARSKRCPVPRPGARLAAIGLCAQLAACGTTAPRFATADELPSGPRRPDGVATDPPTELPAAADTVTAETTVATLRAPPPSEAARAVVHAFFHAVAAEDFDALAALVTADASITPRLQGPSASLLEVWRARMRRLDYLPLAAASPFDDASVETWRASDLTSSAGSHPPRPAEMAATDVLLRVPIAIVRVAGQDRLFADEMIFLLRRDGARFRIRAVVEDFQLP